MVEVREMRPDETKAVMKLGRQTFEIFESLFVPKPEKCYVAVDGSVIVGAVIYKYIMVGDKKIGYVDFIFTDKTYHGQGIGSRLVDACMETMTEEGCDGYSAIVRDDNVGSWKMFVNRGFQRMGLVDMIREFGFIHALNQIFKTPLCVATGMEYYLKLENGPIRVKKEETRSQIINYILFIIVMLLPTLITGIDYSIHVIGALLTILVIRLVAGYIGTLFSKEQWYFRVTDGGILIPFIAAFFRGIYLISGNWYPRVYRKDSGFKQSLGLTALTQWMSLFVIVLLNNTLLGDNKFYESMASMSLLLMIISVIPLYPLASFGGKRLFDWNKWLYILVALITVGTMFLA